MCDKGNDGEAVLSVYMTLELHSKMRRVERDLVFHLPLGSGEEDFLRAAEEYAFSRGWRDVAILEVAHSTADSRSAVTIGRRGQDPAKPLASVPSILRAPWRIPLPRSQRRKVPQSTTRLPD